MSLRKLARASFLKLIDYGIQHLEDRVSFDYFAVSLPDFLVFDEDLNKRNRIHCHYMMALGYLGSGDLEKAEVNFQAALQLNAYHAGAVLHRKLLTEPQEQNPL